MNEAETKGLWQPVSPLQVSSEHNGVCLTVWDMLPVLSISTAVPEGAAEAQMWSDMSKTRGNKMH